jgi:hypothetical protein
MEEDSDYERQIEREMKEKFMSMREENMKIEQALKKSRSQQPYYILWDLVKKMKIRTEPTLSKYELDPNYSRRDPVEDFDKLMRTIKNMRSDGTLPQERGEPPAIVAIQSTFSLPPRWYYVRNDISEGRKKKTVKPKSKRKPVKKCKCK